MKKCLMIISLAIFLGGIFALYMFSDITKTIAVVKDESNIVTAFQIGVFNEYGNAKRVLNTHKDAIIIEDEGKYRVYLAIYQDKEIINTLKKYYEDNNVNIYLKKIRVNDSFVKELNKYENLINKSINVDTIIYSNKKILEIYKNTI